MTSHAPMLDFAGSILYLAALLGDRPRAIDHYIDYFGDGTERARRCRRNRNRSATAAPDRSGA
jgi:hypothetical protein